MHLSGTHVSGTVVNDRATFAPDHHGHPYVACLSTIHLARIILPWGVLALHGSMKRLFSVLAAHSMARRATKKRNRRMTQAYSRQSNLQSCQKLSSSPAILHLYRTACPASWLRLSFSSPGQNWRGVRIRKPELQGAVPASGTFSHRDPQTFRITQKHNDIGRRH